MKKLVYLTVAAADSTEGAGHLFGHLARNRAKPDMDDARQDSGTRV